MTTAIIAYLYLMGGYVLGSESNCTLDPRKFEPTDWFILPVWPLLLPVIIVDWAVKKVVNLGR